MKLFESITHGFPSNNLIREPRLPSRFSVSFLPGVYVPRPASHPGSGPKQSLRISPEKLASAGINSAANRRTVFLSRPWAEASPSRFRWGRIAGHLFVNGGEPHGKSSSPVRNALYRNLGTESSKTVAKAGVDHLSLRHRRRRRL
jgi:hypothetical protein